MSAIGEAHAFDRLAHKYRVEAVRTADPTKKARLEQLADQYDRDAAQAWRDARHEADLDHDARPRGYAGEEFDDE